MSGYYMNIKNFTSNAVSHSAYITRERRYSSVSKKSMDYTRKSSDVIFKSVVLCKNAPAEYSDGKTLWNAVEKFESEKKSRQQRNFIIAIPQEFNDEEQKEVVKEFQDFLAEKGMCSEACIHNPESKRSKDKIEKNKHVHVLATCRLIEKDGQWKKIKEKKVIANKSETYTDEDGNTKTRYLYDENLPNDINHRFPVLDDEKLKVWKENHGTEFNLVSARNADGSWNKDILKLVQKGRTRDGKGTEWQWQRCVTEDNPLNKKELIEDCRKAWADICNDKLKRKGSQDRIDHRSYERQGVTKVAQRHEGYSNITSEVKRYNFEVEAINFKREKINKELSQRIKISKEVLADENRRTIRRTTRTDRSEHYAASSPSGIGQEIRYADGGLQQSEKGIRSTEGKLRQPERTIQYNLNRISEIENSVRKADEEFRNIKAESAEMDRFAENFRGRIKSESDIIEIRYISIRRRTDTIRNKQSELGKIFGKLADLCGRMAEQIESYIRKINQPTLSVVEKELKEFCEVVISVIELILDYARKKQISMTLAPISAEGLVKHRDYRTQLDILLNDFEEKENIIYSAEGTENNLFDYIDKQSELLQNIFYDTYKTVYPNSQVHGIPLIPSVQSDSNSGTFAEGSGRK